MRIAFNALSVTNLSGRHVLLGHVRQIVSCSRTRGRHLLLYHAGNRDLAESLRGQLDMHECPSATMRWPSRWLWERLFLSRLLRDQGVDAVFSPSGMITPGLKKPQLSLAQNPWCLVPDARKGLLDEMKASIQRQCYRQAQHGAALMLFNSEYMKDLYRKNAGFDPVDSLVLHQGIDTEIFTLGRDAGGFDDRQCEIVVVSVMAWHKNIEDIIDVMRLLHQSGLAPTLKLIGPWPDSAYRAFIHKKVSALDLGKLIEISGYVSREELYRHYSKARVFCLLSRCESFGIPAIEAQGFGTPSVVANCGAPAEIAGPGGVVVAPGDLSGAAEGLRRLLSDPEAWSSASARARDNAERFRWQHCTKPLIDLLADWR